MLPGSHPFEELESALQHVAVDPPSDLLETLEGSDDGLAQVVGRILPDDGTELVLVVDQLEEVFTMVEDEQLRNRFLRSLVAATQETRRPAPGRSSRSARTSSIVRSPSRSSPS